MTKVLERINELGFTLPDSPKPVATYVPYIMRESLLYTSGQIPMVNGVLQFQGAIPSSQPIEAGIESAQLCGLNTLAVASSALDGDLDRISRVMQLKVYVASDPGFTDQSLIANGVSNLMVAIFGEKGRHVRAAVGSIGLPLGATTEVEAVFELASQ